MTTPVSSSSFSSSLLSRLATISGQESPRFTPRRENISCYELEIKQWVSLLESIQYQFKFWTFQPQGFHLHLNRRLKFNRNPISEWGDDIRVSDSIQDCLQASAAVLSGSSQLLSSCPSQPHHHRQQLGSLWSRLQVVEFRTIREGFVRRLVRGSSPSAATLHQSSKPKIQSEK